jgi:hypothetical protein
MQYILYGPRNIVICITRTYNRFHFEFSFRMVLSDLRRIISQLPPSPSDMCPPWPPPTPPSPHQRKRAEKKFPHERRERRGRRAPTGALIVPDAGRKSPSMCWLRRQHHYLPLQHRCLLLAALTSMPAARITPIAPSVARDLAGLRYHRSSW